jgi:hypothetical protein
MIATIGFGLLVKILFFKLNRPSYYKPASKNIAVSRDTIKYGADNYMIFCALGDF